MRYWLLVFFTQSKPGWVDDFKKNRKKLKSYFCFGPEIRHFAFLAYERKKCQQIVAGVYNLFPHEPSTLKTCSRCAYRTYNFAPT
jgi:hypothetical protein